MKHLLLTLLCLLSLAFPAHARITLGVTVSPAGLFHSEAQAQHLGAALGQRLHQEVVVRVFQDEATLHDWLNRFRTVDVGVLSRPYLRRQPGGEFLQVADYWRPGQKGVAGDRVVARQGFSPESLRRVQNALLGLSEQGRRSPVLDELNLARFVLPGESPEPEPSPFLIDPPAPEPVAPAAAVVAEPEASPKVEAKKKSKTKAQPKPEPKPKPKPAAKPQPKPEPKPKPKPEPPTKGATGALSAEPEAAATAVAGTPPEQSPPPAVLSGEAPTGARAGDPAPPETNQGSSSTPTWLYLLLALMTLGLTAAAGYLVWQVRRLNRAVQGFTAEQPPDKDESPPG